MEEINQNHTGNGDNVAGDKIIFQFDAITNRVSELISILKLRANEINEKLSRYAKEVYVDSYLKSFNDLHNNHIKALKESNLMLAHEYLIKIHEISNDLEQKINKSKWFERTTKPSIHLNYLSTSFGFFNNTDRGGLICKYIVDKLEKDCRNYPDKFSKFESIENKNDYDKHKMEDIVKIYSLILNSSNTDK